MTKHGKNQDEQEKECNHITLCGLAVNNIYKVLTV